jgi:hypothetical protein
MVSQGNYCNSEVDIVWTKLMFFPCEQVSSINNNKSTAWE